MNRTTPPTAGRADSERCRRVRWTVWSYRLLCVGLLGLILVLAGCTSPKEFVRNGFKVGPNYQRPPAPLANEWIDSANPQIKSAPADYSEWWAVFGDPVLNDLVHTAYAQNVNLRVAATRVMEARAQRAIAVGTLFPQQQQATGDYTRVNSSRNVADPLPRPFFNNWATGLFASWEIDFWGKIRRNIETTTDLVQASVDDYDNVMVTLIGDLASAYVQYRVAEQQLVYARENVRIQRGMLKIATDQFKVGKIDERNVFQSTSLVEQVEATIPAFEIQLRQANNQICVLLGIPPVDLSAALGKAPIPRAPAEVVVGVPADLIRRRPDLRSAERQIAAQNAQIGVAEADLYPAFFINGTIGYEATDLGHLFTSKSFTGQIGPAFQWNILNYGRIVNNVQLQDFKTQELVAAYQQKVLSAAQDVENGLVTFWRSRQSVESLAAAVRAAERTVKLVGDQFTAGAVDFTPVFVAEQFQIQTQTEYAQAQGDIALGLIQVYRALGGGWELRLAESGAQPGALPPPAFRDGDRLIPPVPPTPDPIPDPRPIPKPVSSSQPLAPPMLTFEPVPPAVVVPVASPEPEWRPASRSLPIKNPHSGQDK